MEYCFLRGFLVVLLIQRCTCKDPPTSMQSFREVTLQDGLTSHREQEPELPSAAEVVPVVAPPTLKEVQRAVQEASEQAEGRGAEEVLKELLERVVEAALTQVDSEVKEEVVDEATADTDEQGLTTGSEGEDVVVQGGHAGAGEEHGAAEVEALEDEAEEGKGTTEGEGETAAGSVVEATVGVETGGKGADGVEVINESLDGEFSQGFAEATLAALDETGAEEEEEVVMEDSNKQDVLSKEAAETGTLSAEESPATWEVGVDIKTQKETLEQSDHSLAESDEEQLAGALEREGALEEKAVVDESESEVTVVPSDHYETQSPQTVAGEQGEVGEEVVKETLGPAAEDERGQLMVEGGADEEVEAGGRDVEEAAGGERESERTEAAKKLVNEGGERQVEEERVTLEIPETLVIPASEPDASKEQNPESPSLDGVTTEDNTRGNEIIAPTDHLSPRDPVAAQPTLDNVVTAVLAEGPQAGGDEPGEAIELVEDTTGTTETRELGLEAWKIGAVLAAVFLVLETAVIVIYVLKCRNQNNTQATERTCEEGSVEPEATTGGECSDDTLPAGNGNAQQIPALDPLDMVSTQNKEQQQQQHEENHAITLSDLAPSSREESADTGPAPHSSQELRTSNL